MKRILLSWMAFNHDFHKGAHPVEVNEEGTTANFHRYFYDQQYEKHLILSSAKGDETRMEFLLNYLAHAFPEHVVETKYMGVNDVINLELIRSKVEPLLLESKNREIDLFISPGTPTMQTAWILAHMTLGLNTRLLQVRPREHTQSKKQPELVFMDVTKDATTSSAIIRQAKNEKPLDFQTGKDFLKTASIQSVYQNAFKVAQAPNSTVLIMGETGTGKEHLAHFIHDQSPRREAPFHAVNCSAMSDPLLESRLFGYKKGAFTDADKDTPGIIEQTEGGTLFLDEIGDISPYMQQALLRVLQEKEITPIGGKSKTIDVRFITATNKDLFSRCEQGQFRWDLYYRLSVVDLELPSLQARGIQEIKDLIQFFIKQKKKLFNVSKALEIPAEVMDRLLSYPFPGNIRELENLIERLYVLRAGEEVQLKDLPARMLNISSENSLRLKDIEKWHIERVLQLNKGKQRKTAEDLGIVYNTLMKKIGDYGIDIIAFRD